MNTKVTADIGELKIQLGHLSVRTGMSYTEIVNMAICEYIKRHSPKTKSKKNGAN